MGTFDSILEQFGDSAGDLFGSDAGDLLDNVKHTFADNGDGSDDSSDGDGGSSWTDTLGGLFGGGSDDGEDGESGGGWGALSGLVDRLSGDGEDDGDSDSMFSSVIDKATSFLPDDLRAEAESLFRGSDGGSSWAGSLLDRATDARGAATRRLRRPRNRSPRDDERQRSRRRPRARRHARLDRRSDIP